MDKVADILGILDPEWLIDGYTGEKGALSGLYRPMTVYEAKRLRAGEHAPARDTSGKVRTVTINGRPKTWKTRPGDVRVPLKYGLYEYLYDSVEGGAEGDPMPILLVRLDP